MKDFLKTITIFIFCAVAAFAVFYNASCTTDKCKATVCANGGICNNGTCTCLPGYAGANCDSISKNNFLGVWTVNETGTITPLRSYSISIISDTTITGVIINNFYNYFRPIRGTINHDTLTIYNQQLQGKTIFGKGYIYPSSSYGNYGSIVMMYEVADTSIQVVDDFGVYPLVDHSKASNWAR